MTRFIIEKVLVKTLVKSAHTLHSVDNDRAAEDVMTTLLPNGALDADIRMLIVESTAGLIISRM
jgi:hypothetical protein